MRALIVVVVLSLGGCTWSPDEYFTGKASNCDDGDGEPFDNSALLIIRRASESGTRVFIGLGAVSRKNDWDVAQMDDVDEDGSRLTATGDFNPTGEDYPTTLDVERDGDSYTGTITVNELSCDFDVRRDD